MKKDVRKPSNRGVYVTTYHPALPSYSKILNRAWKVMVKDPYLKDVFKKPPMVAYRQPRNSSLQSLLVKTKLAKETRSRRTRVVMKKCNRHGCNTCPLLHTTEKVKSSKSNLAVKLKTLESCVSYNVVYCITLQQT